MKVIVSLGGKSISIERFKEIYKKGDYIIGVDKGCNFLYKNKIKPKLILGDFDSIDKKILNYYNKQKEIIIKKFSKKKNKTDGELALIEAKKIKTNKIIIFGINLNCDTDHFLANIFLLFKYKKVKIITEKECIFLLEKKYYKVYKKNGKKISFLPITKTKIFLQGFDYSGLFESDISDTLMLRNKISLNIGKINLINGKIFLIQGKI